MANPTRELTLRCHQTLTGTKIGGKLEDNRWRWCWRKVGTSEHFFNLKPRRLKTLPSIVTKKERSLTGVAKAWSPKRVPGTCTRLWPREAICLCRPADCAGVMVTDSRATLRKCAARMQSLRGCTHAHGHTDGNCFPCICVSAAAWGHYYMVGYAARVQTVSVSMAPWFTLWPWVNLGSNASSAMYLTTLRFCFLI